MASDPQPTPRELGYRMPPEWAPHRATWLTWPRPGSSSFGGREERVEPALARLVRILAQDEEVRLCVWDAKAERSVRRRFEEAGGVPDNVHFHHFPAYEPWCRDHGPIFVAREATPRLAAVDWEYNAWGGKYPPYDLDNEIPRRIAEFRGCPRFEPRMVLEGGAIDVNGAGSLLATESCLLNPNRNPGMDRAAIEKKLRDFLGVDQILWLGRGIEGDDTDGHVDDLARFVSADTIVAAVETNRSDPNFEPLRENLERLKRMRSFSGKRFQIVELPMPAPVWEQGVRLPAAYLNFYIANEKVIVPVFGDRRDEEAVAALEALFKPRRVEALDCREIIWGLGAAHCLTQQEPL